MPSTPLPKIGKLITYASLNNDQWPRIDDLTGILSRFSRTDVVLRVAWLLTAIEAWKRVESNTQDRKVRDFVFPTLKQRFPQEPNRFVFSRYSLLWLMRQAFVNCSAEGQQIKTRDELEMLGMACLISNDLSTYRVPRRLESDLDFAANMLSLTDVFSQEEFDRDIARTRFLLTEVAADSVRTEVQDVPKAIEEAIGFTIAEYCDLALAAGMKSIAADVTNIASLVAPGVRAENFQTTAVTPERAEVFLESISADENTFVEEFRKGTPEADVTAIRQWPLLRLTDGSYAILDAGFVWDKAGKGLFWTGLKRCPTKNRLKILGFWGELFELYVNKLLSEAPHTARRLLANPRFRDGAEALDVCVLENRTLLAIEVKASTLPSNVRYADDSKLLGEEIEKRFVVGDDSGPKGLSQLATFLRRFSSGEPIYDSENGTSLDCTAVDKIIPVLIHLDTALRTFRMNHYMAGRLTDLVRIKRLTVTPLALIPITELEQLQGWITELLLSDIIESYLKYMRRDRAAVFFAGQIPLMAGKQGRIGPTQRRMNDILDGMVARLFPEEKRGLSRETK